MNDDQASIPERLADHAAADMADDQLLDAILRGRTQDTADTMDARVAQVMNEVASTQRLPREQEPSGRFTRGFRLASIARPVAAVILFGTLISLMLVVSRPQPAEATLLARAIERMGAEDLTYSITVASTPNASPETRPSIDRKAARDRHPGSRAFAWKRSKEEPARRGSTAMFNRLDGATLRTSGERWCLLVPSRNGMIYARGFDGQQAWTNRPQDPGRTVATPRRPGEERANGPQSILEFATLDLSDMLVKLDQRYEVSEPRKVDSELDDSTLVRHEAVLKTRRQTSERMPGRNHARAVHGEPRKDHLPRSIEIWADPESERIVFLRLSGMRARGEDNRLTLELALESTDPIPDLAFTRDGHEDFASDRRVGDRPSPDRRREAERTRERSRERPNRGRSPSTMGREP